MAKILEIHHERRLPELSEEEMEKMSDSLQSVLRDYPNTELKEILVSEEGIAVERWEAPDAKTVEEIVEKLIGPNHCDCIVEVEPLDLG